MNGEDLQKGIESDHQQCGLVESTIVWDSVGLELKSKVFYFLFLVKMLPVSAL